MSTMIWRPSLSALNFMLIISDENVWRFCLRESHPLLDMEGRKDRRTGGQMDRSEFLRRILFEERKTDSDKMSADKSFPGNASAEDSPSCVFQEATHVP